MLEGYAWGRLIMSTTVQRKQAIVRLLLFENSMGQTRLTYRTVFEETPAIFDKVKEYAVPGAEQTMIRLRVHLASLSKTIRVANDVQAIKQGEHR